LPKPSKPKGTANAFAKYSGIAFKMLLIIGVFTYMGTLIDTYYPNKYKLATLSLSFTGVGLALYTTLRNLIKDQK
jgi:hypothetical protein